jgi:hypothetical protein
MVNSTVTIATLETNLVAIADSYISIRDIGKFSLVVSASLPPMDFLRFINITLSPCFLASRRVLPLSLPSTQIWRGGRGRRLEVGKLERRLLRLSLLWR